jgi:hypothetical protein
LLAINVGAESLSTAAFQYKGGKLGYLERNEVYSAWNANDPVSVLKPGMKVMFFGRAEGCDLRAGNGPVKNQGSVRFSQTFDLTGIPLASEGKGQRWAPSADSEQCGKSVRDQVGDSFVHVNEDQENGGIGIFTFTGPDQKGRRSFFRQFDKSGKNGTGANANIEGTFVAFRFGWQKGNTVLPWAGGEQPDEKRKAEFRTVQSVAVASVGDGVVGLAGEPIQAKQQFIAAFINRACFQSGGGKKGMCQLQYLFNVAVYRAGVTDWDAVKWFKSAGVFMDPAQGGMPVVHGPVRRSGETTVDEGSGLELYTSLGEPSRHDIFKDKEFRIQVSFSQLKNALKIVAGKQLKKMPNKISQSDLEAVFGEHWGDANEWLLLSVNVSQEVYNSDSNARALIGGGIKAIAVGIAPPN